MECTQRLECTQDLYSGQQTERSSPDQVGFLGICGTKYPVKRGPNKVGRDPQTCSIILNLNSISRQHAVVNILNARDYMLMDLDSANKTKLMGKSLQPYIPHPLKDGDTVQFGDVFGIFRLLEEDNDLPMTQAIDIPDTPVLARHVSRLNHVPVTTIPESPDVSGDDSFIIPTQPKGDNQFKSPGNKYIKTFTKTTSIQPIGTDKIDNIYWRSSKKSTSINLDDSSSSLNDSNISLKFDKNDIHEMETQPPFVSNERSDAIYTAETQMPNELNASPSIHSQDTQLPVPVNSKLPFVCKIDNQHDMQFDLYTSNKENDNSIYNAETQLFEKDKNTLKVNKISGINIFDADTQLPKDENRDNVEDSIFNAETQLYTIEKKVVTTELTNKSKNTNNTSDKEILSILEAVTQSPAVEKRIKSDSGIFNAGTQLSTAEKKNVTTECTNKSKDTTKDKLTTSDEDILFDDVDGQSFDDDFYSQPLLPPYSSPDKNVDVASDKDEEIVLSQTDTTDDEIVPKPGKRVMRLKSDTSTDSDDFDVPTNKLSAKCINEDDLTDCEEDLFPEETKKDKESVAAGSPNINFEDMPTQIIEDVIVLDSPQKPDIDAIDDLVKEPSFEEMATQVLPEDVPEGDIQFEDLPTQILEEDYIVKPSIIDDQQFSEEIVSPFKIPLRTPLKMKRKEASKLIDEKPNTKTSEAKPSPTNKEVDHIDDRYYKDTQEILEDLCSQRESSPEIVNLPQVKTLNNNFDKDTEHIVVIDSNAGNQLSPKKQYVIKNKSSGSSDGDERISNYVTNLSISQIKDVIGIDVQDGKPKRTGSDPLDLEVTPKKVRPFKLMQTELPNSQEIKCNVNDGHGSKSLTTETSSESEVEEDSQDGTPIVFHKKKRSKKNIVKVDLTKKFDTHALPIRVLTRVRKPTSKILDSDEETKKRTKNILKPKFLTEQDDDVDKDIISENITRLKNKNEKKNNKKPIDDNIKIDDGKNRDVNKADGSAATVDSKPRKRGHKEKDTKSPNTAMGSVISDTTKTKDGKSADTLKPKDNKAKDTKSPDPNKATTDTGKIKDTKSLVINKPKTNVSRDIKSQNSNKSKDSKTPDSNKPENIKNSNTNETKDVKNTDTNKTKDTKKADTNISNNKMNQQSMIEFLKKPDTKKTKEFESPSTDTTNLRSRRTRNNSRDQNSKSTTEVKQANASKGISKSTVEAMLSTSNTNKTNSSLDLTSETKRSTRNSGNKANDNKVSTENENIRKRGRPRKPEKVEEKTDSSPENEPEIRRSRRQKPPKRKIVVDELQKLKAARIGAANSTVNVSTSKLSENSAVYNVSSGSDVSVQSLKRSAMDTEGPRAKRSRVVTTLNNMSLRATPARTGRVQHVLFTAFPYDEVRVKLEKLGAVIVSDVKACSVVVTAQVRRTFKLLCCVGLGRPVAGPAWVQACVDNNTLVDPWLYLIHDEASESRFKFCLRSTLSGPRGFLRGYHVSATPAVLPAAPEMRQIVECSGGVWRAQGPQWLCVSCSADRALWPRLRQQGALVVSSELILSGVLRQQLDIQRNLLDQPPVVLK